VYYYGVICCAFDNSMCEIEGDHDYKPATECAGIAGTCKWFTDETKKNEFIAYAMNELHYHLDEI